MDEVRIEAPNEPKKEASDDLIERLKEMQIKRAIGGGLRRMPRAEDVEREMNADGGSTRYVPPSLRGGRGEGERMKTSNDSATLRVTNLSSDATQSKTCGRYSATMVMLLGCTSPSTGKQNSLVGLHLLVFSIGLAPNLPWRNCKATALIT